MEDLSRTEVLVDVRWIHSNGAWSAVLVTSVPHEFIERPLRIGAHLALEVGSERRCIGYSGEDASRPCPSWAEIESGFQCVTCREQDVHRAYIEGHSGADREGTHSVYLAQCGAAVKMGVTRSSRLEQRWVEQGAAFAVEIAGELTASEALEVEAQLVEAGLRERIRKAEKVPYPTESRLEAVMADQGLTGNVVDIRALTEYTAPSDKPVASTGRFGGAIQSVVGNLVEVGDQFLAVIPGKCIHPAEQMSISDF